MALVFFRMSQETQVTTLLKIERPGMALRLMGRPVGFLYPFITMIATLLLMISPPSQFFEVRACILERRFQRMGHACVPFVGSCLIAVFFVARQADNAFTVNDLPIFVVPTVLHVSDIVFTLIGGYGEILWIVLLTSCVQTAFLLFAYLNNRRCGLQSQPA